MFVSGHSLSKAFNSSTFISFSNGSNTFIGGREDDNVNNSLDVSLDLPSSWLDGYLFFYRRLMAIYP